MNHPRLSRRAVKKKKEELYRQPPDFETTAWAFSIKGFEHVQTEYNWTQLMESRNLFQVVIISKEDVKRVNKLQIITFIYIVSYFWRSLLNRYSLWNIE